MKHELEDLTLARGTHASPEDGLCAMEAAARPAGEPHSAYPQCVCPTIGTFMRRWNDILNDDDRNRLLKPLLPSLIGTNKGEQLAEVRSWMAIDWAIREMLPMWLDTASLGKHALALRSLPRVDGPKIPPATIAAVDAARAAARVSSWDVARAAWDPSRVAARNAARAAVSAGAGDAARSVAWDAATNASWNAAGDATWAAAGAAAGAAGDAAATATRHAAWNAAWNTPGDTAWNAAKNAAKNALRPTVVAVQASALLLIERMVRAEGKQ